MPRLVDADKLMQMIPTEEYNARMAITYAPTVDAVPVVRCKDCKWFHIHKTAIWCEKEEGLNHPQYDRFCSFGEMREGDN